MGIAGIARFTGITKITEITEMTGITDSIFFCFCFFCRKTAKWANKLAPSLTKASDTFQKSFKFTTQKEAGPPLYFYFLDFALYSLLFSFFFFSFFTLLTFFFNIFPFPSFFVEKKLSFLYFETYWIFLFLPFFPFFKLRSKKITFFDFLQKKTSFTFFLRTFFYYSLFHF